MYNKLMVKPKSSHKIGLRISKKHLWWIIPLVGVFVLLLVQIFWPADLVRPFSKIGETRVGLKNKSEISENIQEEFSVAQIVLSLNGKREEVEFASLGASVQSDFVDAQLFGYDFPEKLIPFSLFFGRNLNHLELNFDEKNLGEFIKKYATKNKIEAKDSTIKLNEAGEIEVVQSVEGREVEAKKLANSIKSKSLILGEKTEVAVDFVTLSPKISTEKLEISKRRAEQILSKNFAFNFVEEDGMRAVQKIYTPMRAEVATWLSFDEDGNLKINDGNFTKYIAFLNQEREVKPTATLVKIVDGREESRENGEKGVRISAQKMKQELLKYLSGEVETPDFDLLFEEVASPEQKSYSYTNSQAGLKAKVDEIGRRYNVRISLRQLNGAGWEANYRAGESTPSASTYKLFVAIKLFDEMKKGNRNWESEILGTSTRDCFYRMIILSTNACAEEWIRQFGRNEINNFAYSFGVSSNTNFNSYDAVRTTAGDLRKTVEKIYSGEIVSGENRQILLDHMNRQKWRAGIPAGSKGKVFDKVGFLWDYVHDAGIVEHPRGTYAIAIMTKGANYAAIAQITREVEAFMYP